MKRAAVHEWLGFGLIGAFLVLPFLRPEWSVVWLTLAVIIWASLGIAAQLRRIATAFEGALQVFEAFCKGSLEVLDKHEDRRSK